MQLDYKIVNVPAHMDDSTHAVLLLHGIGGNTQTMQALGKSLSKDLLIVNVQGTYNIEGNKYEWYHINFTQKPALPNFEQVEISKKALVHLMQQLVEEYNISQGNLFLAGFSQGGIISCNLLFEKPELLSGIIVLNGRIAPHQAMEISSPEEFKKSAVLIIHGSKDTVIKNTIAQEAAQIFIKHQLPTTYKEFDIEHEIVQDEFPFINNWIKLTIENTE